MPSISEAEKIRRHNIVQSVIGTHAIEGIEPDEPTKALFRKYESGEFTMDQFSAAMDDYAFSLIAANPPLAGVA